MVRAVIEGWAGRRLASGKQRIAGLGDGCGGGLGRCAGRERAHSRGVGVAEVQFELAGALRATVLLRFIHTAPVREHVPACCTDARYVSKTMGALKAASSSQSRLRAIRTPSDKTSTEPMGRPHPPLLEAARKSIMPTSAAISASSNHLLSPLHLPAKQQFFLGTAFHI